MCSILAMLFARHTEIVYQEKDGLRQESDQRAGGAGAQGRVNSEKSCQDCRGSVQGCLQMDAAAGGRGGPDWDLRDSDKGRRREGDAGAHCRHGDEPGQQVSGCGGRAGAAAAACSAQAGGGAGQGVRDRRSQGQKGGGIDCGVRRDLGLGGAAPQVIRKDIADVQRIDDTHLFSFWEGINVEDRMALGKLAMQNKDLKGVAVMAKAIRGETPAEYMQGLGFPAVTLKDTFPVHMAGSGQGFTAYVFKVNPR